MNLEVTMELELIIVGLAALGLLIYLIYAMLHPERF
ncbi:MAG: K(+)-transporting ATPase subunit F [Anaerolineae bacterium]|nr:K(+)-transporting ATPase subunit F [Anaerolineae bacterium]